MKRVIIAGMLLLQTAFSFGQGNAGTDPGIVKSFLGKVQKAYRETEKLSFHVLYRYANKSQPGNYLDTMSGQVAMGSNRMRFAINGIEMILTDKYSIRIIEDERLIYLSKASRTGMPDPVALLDSLLVQANNGHAKLNKDRHLSTLLIEFPPGQVYNSIRMTLDERTGFLQKIVYNLQTAGFVAQELINLPNHPAPYQPEGIVEVIFSEYKRGAFDETMLDETSYFVRRGAHFEPSERYNGYRVFVASPNL